MKTMQKITLLVLINLSLHNQPIFAMNQEKLQELKQQEQEKRKREAAEAATAASKAERETEASRQQIKEMEQLRENIVKKKERIAKMEEKEAESSESEEEEEKPRKPAIPKGKGKAKQPIRKEESESESEEEEEKPRKPATPKVKQEGESSRAGELRGRQQEIAREVLELITTMPEFCAQKIHAIKQHEKGSPEYERLVAKYRPQEKKLNDKLARLQASYTKELVENLQDDPTVQKITNILKKGVFLIDYGKEEAVKKIEPLIARDEKQKQMIRKKIEQDIVAAQKNPALKAEVKKKREIIKKEIPGLYINEAEADGKLLWTKVKVLKKQAKLAETERERKAIEDEIDMLYRMYPHIIVATELMEERKLKIYTEIDISRYVDAKIDELVEEYKKNKKNQ